MLSRSFFPGSSQLDKLFTLHISAIESSICVLVIPGMQIMCNIVLCCELPFLAYCRLRLPKHNGDRMRVAPRFYSHFVQRCFCICVSPFTIAVAFAAVVFEDDVLAWRNVLLLPDYVCVFSPAFVWWVNCTRIIRVISTISCTGARECKRVRM